MVKDDKHLPWTKRERGSEKEEWSQRDRNEGQEIYNFQISFFNIFLQILKRPKYIYNNLNMLKNKYGNPGP